MNEYTVCHICGLGSSSEAGEVVQVPSNVRQWRDGVYTMWRCEHCESLHALESRDLSKIYEEYPFQRRRIGRITRLVFQMGVRRLKKHGLTTASSILDYGCGEGSFLEYLKEHGYTDSAGYDPYSAGYRDSTVLAKQYDVVICQDVLEHAEDPLHLVDALSHTVGTGGLLYIGTPRADGIDLLNPQEHIHSLHQPFHLHIVSLQTLVTMVSRKGFSLERAYLRHSGDTPYPFVNWAFGRAYLAMLDNTVDAGFDPPQPGLALRSPRLWFLGYFGYLFPSPSEMVLIFRKL